MVTEISSAHLPDSDIPSWAQSWDPLEMQSYLDKGICSQVETTERIGIQPYWIRSIEIGAMEELRHEVGKWSKTHQGYVLGFKRPVQVPEVGLQGRNPHVYVYYRFKVVRYLYSPVAGKCLKGIITQFGTKAASCVMFDKFVATVYPRNQIEFNSWNIGDEIEFLVESFEKLYKGVAIKGKSVGTETASNKKWNFDDAEEAMEANGEEEEALPVTSNEINGDVTESAKSKKKSKKRKLKPDPEEQEQTELAAAEPEPEVSLLAEEAEPPKKKRKKSKKDAV